MKLSITNAQKGCRINTGNIRAMASYFLDKASRRTGIHWGNISIVITNDALIHEINSTSLGHDFTTDVISFNFDPIAGEPENTKAGELFINVELACRLGSIFKKGPDHEFALYLAHGCDHLSGADDNTQQRRRQMRRRELQWIQDARRQGLSFQLIVTPQ